MQFLNLQWILLLINRRWKFRKKCFDWGWVFPLNVFPVAPNHVRILPWNASLVSPLSSAEELWMTAVHNHRWIMMDRWQLNNVQSCMIFIFESELWEYNKPSWFCHYNTRWIPLGIDNFFCFLSLFHSEWSGQKMEEMQQMIRRKLRIGGTERWSFELSRWVILKTAIKP